MELQELQAWHLELAKAGKQVAERTSFILELWLYSARVSENLM